METAVEVRALEPLWKVEEHYPSLLVTLGEPSVEQELTLLEEGVPTSSTCEAFREGAFFRPVGHTRSFCKRVNSGVLVFKGTEPFAHDYEDSMLRAWNERPYGLFSILEHFVFREHEVYMGQTRDAALACAEVSADFVFNFERAMSKLPRTPFPLRVFEVPPEVTERFLDASDRYLTNRPQLSAREKTRRYAANGLAVYVYYYPSVPIRVAHHRRQFPGAWGMWDEQAMHQKSNVTFDVDSAIRSWVTLCAEMLVAGYLPTTPVHTGHCFLEQNLVVDGGVCDIDSVEPMKRVDGERDFLDALLFSVSGLIDSIVGLIGVEDLRQVVQLTVWNSLLSELAQYGERYQLDQRLANWISLDSYERLGRSLEIRHALTEPR